MAMEMDDDAIYAYEQEMREMDEWEQMHAHEMEAAEEELRAMEVKKSYRPPARHQTATDDHNDQDSRSQDVTINLDSRFADTQARTQSLLDRAARILGESDSQIATDNEMFDEYSERKEKVTKLDALAEQFLLHRPPIDTDSMAVVLPTGERRFLRKRATVLDNSHAGPSKATSTYLPPIGELMQILEKRQIEAEMGSAVSSETLPSRQAASATQDTTLWLDKYKPKRFVDLLSDERTNREVLSWIKQWDKYVFPGKKTHTQTWADLDNVNGQSNTSSTRNSSKWKGKGLHKTDSNFDENDPRPREKIILICGPPGAGKTTLANIVARHAGYNPIEVNASDDRTSLVLKSKIINAMEMQSIWGDNKPNCIILDEIDGAMNGGDGKSAIAAIQEIVSTPLNAPSNNRSGKRAAERRGNKHPLIRPLICICNDQYASVLRPLRKLAKIFVLDTPNSQRLVSRLKVICRDEGIKIGTGALTSLCSSGGNDIRYCVNALQLQSTQTKHITSAAVSAGLVGQKDQNRSVFETMDIVFFQPAKAKASTVLVQNVLDQIEEASHGLGNYSLLVNALDENLPKMIFNDPTMSKICEAFEWMGLADSWDSTIRAEQQFALSSYIPFAARAVHLACCTSSRRRVEYPKAQSDSSKKHEKTENILQAFVDNSLLHQSMRNSADVLVVDVVPWLLSILTPSLRPVAVNLQSSDEKATTQRLIELMSTLGLSFRPKMGSDGFEDFVLEPPLNEVVEFRDPDNFGQLVSRSPMLPVAIRKMITREVELEQMRKSEATEMAKASLRADRSTFEKAKKPLSVVDKLSASAQQFVLPQLSEQEEAAKMESIRRRNPFAFAHREAKRKRDAEAKELRLQIQNDNDAMEVDEEGCGFSKRRAGVRYRYNEGYTSGIRTPVYMRDLLN